MSQQFDDAPPEELFVRHHYLKRHTRNLSYTPLNYLPPGYPGNINRMAFIEATKKRRHNPIVMPEKGAQTKGKKIIVKKTPYFEDPTQEI